jgi:hypothetical protein
MDVMVTGAFSDDVRVALRPFVTYRMLGEQPPPRLRDALLQALGWLGLVACFVSWTTSAALLPEHLVFSPLAWCFVPLVQGASAVAVAGRLAESSPARAIALYFRGHAPWYGLLLLISAICLFAAEPWLAFRWLFRTRVAALLGGVAVGWCVLLTYAMFRTGLGLTRRVSWLATSLHYLSCTLVFTSWFLVTGQLLPLWGIM